MIATLSARVGAPAYIYTIVPMLLSGIAIYRISKPGLMRISAIISTLPIILSAARHTPTTTRVYHFIRLVIIMQLPIIPLTITLMAFMSARTRIITIFAGITSPTLA